jgi:hypothetical protein
VESLIEVANARCDRRLKDGVVLGEEHMHGSSVLETEDISRISQTVLL